MVLAQSVIISNRGRVAPVCFSVSCGSDGPSTNHLSCSLKCFAFARDLGYLALSIFTPCNMRSFTSWLALALVAVGAEAAPFQSFDKRQDGGKMVFAHFMVRHTHTVQQHVSDLRRLVPKHLAQAPQHTMPTCSGQKRLASMPSLSTSPKTHTPLISSTMRTSRQGKTV